MRDFEQAWQWPTPLWLAVVVATHSDTDHAVFRHAQDLASAAERSGLFLHVERCIGQHCELDWLLCDALAAAALKLKRAGLHSLMILVLGDQADLDPLGEVRVALRRQGLKAQVVTLRDLCDDKPLQSSEAPDSNIYFDAYACCPQGDQQETCLFARSLIYLLQNPCYADVRSFTQKLNQLLRHLSLGSMRLDFEGPALAALNRLARPQAQMEPLPLALMTERQIHLFSQTYVLASVLEAEAELRAGGDFLKTVESLSKIGKGFEEQASSMTSYKRCIET